MRVVFNSIRRVASSRLGQLLTLGGLSSNDERFREHLPALPLGHFDLHLVATPRAGAHTGTWARSGDDVEHRAATGSRVQG